jgi:2-oxoisovalerate ferredoxin oxidoreductase beta subunit
VENRGFSLVEVLAECPLHLGLTPLEAQRWVEERMLPVYPLGVKKDVAASREPWPAWQPASFDSDLVARLIGASNEVTPRFCDAFPRERWGSDVALKLAGAGGDGAQTAAMIIARAAINEGFDATHIPSYGPESRGGTSYADVHCAEHEVESPAAPSPQILLAFNAPSLAKFGPRVARGGMVIYDCSVAPTAPVLPDVTVFPIPITEIARNAGKLMIRNMVALGALAAATRLFPADTFLTAIRQALAQKPAFLKINEEGFALGMKAVHRRNDW